MARTFIPNDAAYRRHLAALAASVSPQSLPAELPPLRPARLRELAQARRIDAQQRATHLAKRGGEEDYHARWTRLEITRLLEEAADLERQADTMENG